MKGVENRRQVGAIPGENPVADPLVGVHELGIWIEDEGGLQMISERTHKLHAVLHIAVLVCNLLILGQDGAVR